MRSRPILINKSSPLERAGGGWRPSCPPDQKKAAVCDILRRQQPQHLLVFSFSWEFLSAHGLKSCVSARSPSSQYRDPKGALAWNNNVSRSTEMQEVQPWGGAQKTFVGLSGAYWAPGCPRASGGLYFIHGAENKKKYSKPKKTHVGSRGRGTRNRKREWKNCNTKSKGM